jgi:hypothetical protein
VYRCCKNKALSDVDNETHDLFTSFRWFKNHKILPVAGGLLDQAPLFVDVVDFCEHVIVLMDENKRKLEQTFSDLKNRKGKAKR